MSSDSEISSISHLDRKSLVTEGFIIWAKNTIFLRDTVGNPEWAAQVTNHSAGFNSSCILTELAIQLSAYSFPQVKTKLGLAISNNNSNNKVTLVFLFASLLAYDSKKVKECKKKLIDRYHRVSLVTSYLYFITSSSLTSMPANSCT